VQEQQDQDQRVLFDFSGGGELRESGRDVLGIEVEALSDITDGAPRVVSEKADDARLRVAMPVTGRCGPGARAARGRPSHRPRRSGGWTGL
jgi:hypothetical protein